MTRILEALAAAGARSFAEVRAFCEAPPLALRVTELGPLYSLRYQKNKSDFRSQVVRQARGIVLEKETNRIISWAFDKFYEYGEAAPSYTERPNLRLSVTNPGLRYERKYDGVLIKVVRRPGDALLVSTNGCIDAATAPISGPCRGSASSVALGFLSGADGDLGALLAPCEQRHLRQAFAEAGGLDLPYEEGACYVFELLHPDVPTVIPATGGATLVHLSTRRLAGDFSELPPEGRFHLGGVRPPEVLRFPSFGACRAVARLLPWDDEGFVATDAAGTRIKVKSDAYKAMQRLLVGDSDVEEEDAVAVALTLRHAAAPLPAAKAALIDLWRKRAEAFAAGCLARVAAAHGSLPRGGSSARGGRARLEASLGGRVPKTVRAAVAGAVFDGLPELSAPAPDALLDALRQTGISMADLCGAFRAA